MDRGSSIRRQIAQVGKSRYTSTLLFALSIVVTLFFWMVLPASFRINDSTDYSYYYEPLARNILEGRWFSHADGTLATYYPPGYPLLLAGVLAFSHVVNISEPTILSAFSLLCMCLQTLLLFKLARTIWQPFPALVSSLGWMTYPFALWLTKQPFSESPFLVVFYCGFYLFCYVLLRKRSSWLIYFGSGFLIGCAMLIRAIGMGLGFVMVAIVWMVRKDMSVGYRFFLMMMLLLGNFIAILPWEGWIYSKTGTVIALSSGGGQAISDGLTFAVTGGFRRVGGLPPDVMALMKDLANRGGEMKSVNGIIALMSEQLHKRPLTVIKLLAIKSVLSWYANDRRQFEIYTILIQIPYLLLILWGSFAAWKNGGAPKQLTVGIWLMVFYFWAITILVSPLLRYMMAPMGLLFVLMPGFLNRIPIAEPELDRQ